MFSSAWFAIVQSVMPDHMSYAVAMEDLLLIEEFDREWLRIRWSSE